MLSKPTSFSQNVLARSCLKCWYYTYILNLKPANVDMSYADAGKVLHEVIELHYKQKSLDELKSIFEAKWKDKKLDTGILTNKKDSYWLMALNCINKNIPLTSNEFKIFFPDVVGYLDGIDTTNDIIHDWKSSTISEDNKHEYTLQMNFYAYLYYRHFQRIPKKCVVHYLKLNNSNGELVIIPTLQSIMEAEDWHFKTREMISNAIAENKFDKCIDSGRDCHFFCAFKDMCVNNSEGKLSLVLELLGNYIKINGPITPLLHKGLDKKFSYELKNAFFIKKQRPQFDGMIHFWNQNKQIIPIGFMKEVLVTLQHYAEHKKLQLDLQIIDRRQPYTKILTMPDKFVNGKELRDYQIKSVETYLREKIAMLEVGTGGGKTEIAIECIRRLGCKTLFLVDKVELLRQTKKRMEESLGIEIGEIGAGVDNIKDITVATIQTIIKHIHKYSAYLQSIKFVIFDECHHVSAKSYVRVAHYLTNTIYRLGITGTAFRDDGNDMMINSIVGYVCYKLDAKTLIDNGWLIKPYVKFLKVILSEQEVRLKDRKSKEGLINETKDYTSYYREFIFNNEIRNNLITDIVRKNPNKKILILTKLIEHGEIVANLTDGIHLYGATDKEKRKQFLEHFKNGINNVLVSTISIFSEGIDIPALDIIINASANRGDVKSIQVLGRVLRKNEGKEMAEYYDFMDQSEHFFRRASKARITAFRKEGHEVEII